MKKYIVRLTEEERAACEAAIPGGASREAATSADLALSRRLAVHHRESQSHVEAALFQPLAWTGR